MQAKGRVRVPWGRTQSTLPVSEPACQLSQTRQKQVPRHRRWKTTHTAVGTTHLWTGMQLLICKEEQGRVLYSVNLVELLGSPTSDRWQRTYRCSAGMGGGQTAGSCGRSSGTGRAAEKSTGFSDLKLSSVPTIPFTCSYSSDSSCFTWCKSKHEVTFVFTQVWLNLLWKNTRALAGLHNLQLLLFMIKCVGIVNSGSCMRYVGI